MAIQQTPLDINQQLAFLTSTGKWRNCQRKQYNVFAIFPAAGYVFANKLEQPEQFQYIKNKFRKLVVKESQLSEEDKAYLGNNCYVTDGTRVVICGTRGECWTVKPEKFVASYTNTDGSPITKVPTKWTEFSRAQESAPSAKGIQIPAKYLGVYKASWGELTLNDPRSTGHYSGDILVVSMDGKSISPINNEVFAMTFNLNVGGWAQSGQIAPVDKLTPVTLELVKTSYKFDLSTEDAVTEKNVKLEPIKVSSEVKALAKESGEFGKMYIAGVYRRTDTGRAVNVGYKLIDGIGKEYKRSTADVAEIIKNGYCLNARLQVYKGTNIIRIIDGAAEKKVEAPADKAVLAEKKPVTQMMPENEQAAWVEKAKAVAADIGGGYIITGQVKIGTSVAGYIATYVGPKGGVKNGKLTKEQAFEFFKAGKAVNYTVQDYQGRLIIRLKKL